MVQILSMPKEEDLINSLLRGRRMILHLAVKGRVPVRIDSITTQRGNENGRWFDIKGVLSEEKVTFSGCCATRSKNGFLGRSR